MPRFFVLLPALAIVALAGKPEAQAPRPRVPAVKQLPALKAEIPRALRPPQGMCRVWIENVPAAQQPAPTDCATAIRNRPPNGRVVFSEEQERRPPSREEPGGRKNEQKKPKKPGSGG